MKQVFSFICNVCAADTLVVQKVTLCEHMHTVINNGEHADICTGVTRTLLDSGKCQHLFETPLQPRGSRTFGLAPTYCWSFFMACVDNKHENYHKPVKLHCPDS